MKVHERVGISRVEVEMGRRRMANLDLKNYKNRHSFKNKLARVLWNVVWLFLFRPTQKGFLDWWRVFLLRAFGATIGHHSYVAGSCRIWAPWNLSMGDASCLAERVNCYNVDEVRIGDNVVVSQEAFLCTASHDVSSVTMELTTKPIVVESNAWITARTIIMPGVTVGEGSVVAAGAVVTHDVEDWSVVGGVPAKRLKGRILKETCA